MPYESNNKHPTNIRGDNAFIYPTYKSLFELSLTVSIRLISALSCGLVVFVNT